VFIEAAKTLYLEHQQYIGKNSRASSYSEGASTIHFQGKEKEGKSVRLGDVDKLQILEKKSQSDCKC
jgi:hypothetical protein